MYQFTLPENDSSRYNLHNVFKATFDQTESNQIYLHLDFTNVPYIIFVLFFIHKAEPLYYQYNM